MSLHAGAYSHHPPGGQMYAAADAHDGTQVYYTPSSRHSISPQPYWYGQQPRRHSSGWGVSASAYGHGCAFPPTTPDTESDRFNRKRRRCTYMYYVLRQLVMIVPLVVIFLNINIYVSRRGKYLNESTSPSDPIFYAMWLSVPLSCLLLVWSAITVIFRKRNERRGGIPKHFHFGMELCFSLGATICWSLLVVQIEGKKSNGYYAYPYIQYEAALAFLLGLIMLAEFGLLARAWFEFTNDRTRHENEAMVQV